MIISDGDQSLNDFIDWSVSPLVYEMLKVVCSMLE